MGGVSGQVHPLSRADLATALAGIGCRSGCPLGTDAGRYARAVARGDMEQAVRIARRENPLVSACAHICHHPCESRCARGRLDEALALRELKRFAVSQVDPATVAPEPLDGRGAGRRVAVVGAGPAGLAASHDLARLDYRVTLLEADHRAGGMLEQAIPPFRLPRAELRRDIHGILSLGIELRSNAALGHDFSLADLRAEGHERVIVATGLPRGAPLPLGGDSVPGVHDGLEILRALAAGEPVELGETVVVVGGGDTAVDVARAVMRLTREGRLPRAPGVWPAGRTVRLVFRRRELAEGARWEEAHAAESEGIQLLGGVFPRRFLGRERATGIEVSDVATYRDSTGRYHPRPRPGTRRAVPGESVVVAVGRIADPAADPGPGTLEDGGLKRGRDWIAGGDLVRGGSVVAALAAGRSMAARVDQELTGGERRTRIYVSSRGTSPPAANWGTTRGGARAGRAEARVGDDPGGGPDRPVLTARMARAEGSRCLDCFGAVLHDSRIAECALCGRCVSGCPVHALRLVSGAAAHADGLVPGETRVDGTTFLVADDDRCVRCGLCAERCPVGCLEILALREERSAHG